MDVPELDLKQCSSIFVRDEFYENIAAPKYHHFPPSEDVAESDAFFKMPGGRVKNMHQFEATCLEPKLIQENSVLLKTLDIRGRDNGSSNSDVSSTAERVASVRGKKKVRPTLTSTTQTNIKEKSRIQRKFAPEVNIPCNAPGPPTLLEKTSEERSQHLEFHPSSENDDPNLSRVKKKRDAGDSSNEKPEKFRSSSASTASQSTFEMKDTNKRKVQDSQCDPIRLKYGVDASNLASKIQSVRITSQCMKSGNQIGTRQPSGNNVDGLGSKRSESKRSIKSQVGTVQRKVPESSIDSKQGAKPPSRSASQFMGVVRNASGPSCTLATTNVKRICPSEKSQRSTSSRPANQIKSTARNGLGASSTTTTKLSEEASSKVAQNASAVADVVCQSLAVAQRVSSTKQIITSIATAQDAGREILKEGPSVDHANLKEVQESGERALSIERRLTSLQDIYESSCPDKPERCERELLAEQLQSMQINQETTHFPRECGNPPDQYSGVLEEQGRNHESPERVGGEKVDAEVDLQNSKQAFLEDQRTDFSQDLSGQESVVVEASQDLVWSFSQNERADIMEQTFLSAASSRNEPSQITEQACVRNGSCRSNDGNTAYIETTTTTLSMHPKLQKKVKQCSGFGCKDAFLRIMYPAKPCHVKETKKRKSVDLLTHKTLNTESHVPSADISTCQTATMRTAEHHKKRIRTTCPQPFRLRTEERGALKEVQFNQKIVQFHLEKEKCQPAPPTSGIVKEVKGTKLLAVPSKESKCSAKAAQCSHAAVGLGLKHEDKDKNMQHMEDKVKELPKKMVLQSRKMPSFDRPFKPHRSMKPPTIPSSPNFSRRLVKRSTKGEVNAASRS